MMDVRSVVLGAWNTCCCGSRTNALPNDDTDDDPDDDPDDADDDDDHTGADDSDGDFLC